VAPFARLTLDDYRRQMETNVFGVLRTVGATLPALTRARGRLAIIGSVAGHVPTAGASPYHMSKFAVRAFAECLHDELAPAGVRVTLISPGFVVSDIGRVDRHGVLRDEDRSKVPAWLKVPTPKAARDIVNAVASGKREAVITGHGKALVFLYRHFPWLLRAGSRLGGKQIRL
jgi:NAD(P)-dependent dehydrogenase (short-subunit alcohol dehydrogenase family)